MARPIASASSIAVALGVDEDTPIERWTSARYPALDRVEIIIEIIMVSENTLYVVATPIGHRDDLSARAIETLRDVTRIYAEDTRHSLPLMRHHGIDTRLHALHEHNETLEAAAIVEHVRTNGSAALISDAGTPLISDPGFRVVRACRAAGLRVATIPGPCAVTAALSVAGLPTDRFQFVGFPPSRSSARLRWLRELAGIRHTLVLYESPHRIRDSLADLSAILGGAREMTLARELTKRHETLLSGSIDAVLQVVQDDSNQRRGEFVLVVAGTAWQGTPSIPEVSNRETGRAIEGDIRADVGGDDNGDTGGDTRGVAGSEARDLSPGSLAGTGVVALGLDQVITTLLPLLPPKDVARCCAVLCGVRKRDAYARTLELQGRD